MFKNDKESQNFLKDKESLWKNTEKLSDFVGRAQEFDAILFVGGHGRKWTYSATTTANNPRSCLLQYSNVRSRDG